MLHLINSNTNLKAYATTESIDAFASSEEIRTYRNNRLIKYLSAVNFIKNRSDSYSKGLKVVEIGSGSSALLYGMADKKMISHGCGIELSSSRFDFAELWKLECGYHCIENINQSFTDVKFQNSFFDWFIVIDNTFTYLHPVNEKYPKLLLSRAFEALVEGGRILLDFFNYTKRTPGVELQQWNVFCKNDPFSYGLYSHLIENGINTTNSIFIRRVTAEEEMKVEMSKVYSFVEINALLESNGFSVQEVFSTFGGDLYDESESERIVIVAKKGV